MVSTQGKGRKNLGKSRREKPEWKGRKKKTNRPPWFNSGQKNWEKNKKTVGARVGPDSKQLYRRRD